MMLFVLKNVIIQLNLFQIVCLDSTLHSIVKKESAPNTQNYSDAQRSKRESRSARNTVKLFSCHWEGPLVGPALQMMEKQRPLRTESSICYWKEKIFKASDLLERK